MTFHGKTPEEKPKPRARTFAYVVYDGGPEREIKSHEIYFYEHGRVGFWNYGETEGDRILVLATKAFTVREVPNK